jgi:hypothetical protein
LDLEQEIEFLASKAVHHKCHKYHSWFHMSPCFDKLWSYLVIQRMDLALKQDYFESLVSKAVHRKCHRYHSWFHMSLCFDMH